MRQVPALVRHTQEDQGGFLNFLTSTRVWRHCAELISVGKSGTESALTFFRGSAVLNLESEVGDKRSVVNKASSIHIDDHIDHRSLRPDPVLVD
jgi:hypothetical protein